MRRQARQWTLMVLYGADVSMRAPSGSSGVRVSEPYIRQLIELFFAAYWGPESIEALDPWDSVKPYRVWLDGAGEDARAFVRDRVQGVLTNLEEIDQRLQSASQKWRLDRMGFVDRTVLRLATFELLFRTDVPRSVAINEAVELAKMFGASDSGAFVNGLLEQVSTSG